MSIYPRNDWRDYLAHSWGNKPEQKAREKEYNAEYYQKHKEKWGVGTNTKTSKSDPEWLKNYMSAIEKMRRKSGDDWLPANTNDFDSWYKELISHYPGITPEQAKQAWNQVHKTLNNSSSDSDDESASNSSKDKTEKESSGGKSGGGGEKESSSKSKEGDEEPKKSKDTVTALGSLISKYRMSYENDFEEYSLKDDSDTESAFDSFDEFVAEMIELGAVEDEITMDDWKEFKSKDPRK